MERLKCEIRPLRDGEQDRVFLLAEETLHPLATFAGHGERYRPGELLELLARAVVPVADCHGEIAGFAAAEVADDSLAVRCLCVGPAFEARGVGHQLVAWLEGMAIDRRLQCLAAYVPADDTPSLRLYARHEFVVRPDDRRSDMVVLEKPLPTATL